MIAPMHRRIDSAHAFTDVTHAAAATTARRKATPRPIPMVETPIRTPVGPMVAVASDASLYVFAFGDRDEAQLERLGKRVRATFSRGENAITQQLASELEQYFAGQRTHFEVPITPVGTEFQCAAWAGLVAIPYGQTRSYGQQAMAIGRPKAVRAVGQANHANPIAIVVPCHRVIGQDGGLVGYGGELWRKQELLALEASPSRPVHG